jgi:hypothetical protein
MGKIGEKQPTHIFRAIAFRCKFSNPDKFMARSARRTGITQAAKVMDPKILASKSGHQSISTNHLYQDPNDHESLAVENTALRYRGECMNSQPPTSADEVLPNSSTSPDILKDFSNTTTAKHAPTMVPTSSTHTSAPSVPSYESLLSVGAQQFHNSAPHPPPPPSLHDAERTSSVIFMNLTISLRDHRITTLLYSKPLNLYLYIPPQSAHPPGVLNGLISGIIFRIYTLCSDPTDIRNRLQAFWNRLLACGYNAVQIRLPFGKGMSNAKSFTSAAAPPPDVASDNPLFFHLQYHPPDSPSSVIQQAWKDKVAIPRHSQPLASLPICSRKERGKTKPFKFDRLIVCYSRQPNLGNLLSYRKITNASGPPVSSYNPRITDR